MRKIWKNKTEVVGKVARGLRQFGYSDLTDQEVRDVLDAWLEGKREHDLPHGIIGLMAGRQFNDVEEAAPGSLALLEND